jgi:glycosyltransferase involved in cell wall biosynthesis
MLGSPPVVSRCDKGWRDALLHSLQTIPNLEYIGPQSQTQVNQWLARSHLLVSTSLQEGFPNTFIQAWMRQVPVVSLHVNPDNVLEREAIGLCVKSEDQLVDAVRALLLDPRRREQYGHSARRYALEHHSLRNTQRVTELIDECLLTGPTTW